MKTLLKSAFALAFAALAFAPGAARAECHQEAAGQTCRWVCATGNINNGRDCRNVCTTNYRTVCTSNPSTGQNTIYRRESIYNGR
jgi:hypothetical protein